MRTLSIIKADTGGWVGHSSVHPDQEAAAGRELRRAIESGLVDDAHVASCGDDLALIMSHRHGADAQVVHSFAWDVFRRTSAVADELGLHGGTRDDVVGAGRKRAGPHPAGADRAATDGADSDGADSDGVQSDGAESDGVRSHGVESHDVEPDDVTPDGELRGPGLGYAELEIGEERPSEPVLCFLTDQAQPGAWNYPLFRTFADPFTSSGLVVDPAMREGFVFEVYDLQENTAVELACPAETYDLLLYVGVPSRYVIHCVRSAATGVVAAATSTQRLSLIAGRSAGQDDPVMIVRAESGLPSVGEVLEPFAFPYSVAGGLRGAHRAPLMPVGLDDAHPTRSDGPPRVVCLGFQLTDGELIGPRDMFADPSFDRARSRAVEVMDYYRHHGPFEPHRLAPDPLRTTTTPAPDGRLASRWVPLTAADVRTPEALRKARQAREQAAQDHRAPGRPTEKEVSGP